MCTKHLKWTDKQKATKQILFPLFFWLLLFLLLLKWSCVLNFFRCSPQLYICLQSCLVSRQFIVEEAGHCRALGLSWGFEVLCDDCSGQILGTQDTLVAEQFTFLTVLKPAGMWEPKNWACSAVDALEAGRTSWLIIQQIFFGNPCGLCQDFVGTSIPLRTISVFDTFGLCSFLMQFLGQFGSWLHAFGEAVAIGVCHEKKGSHIHSDLPH